MKTKKRARGKPSVVLGAMAVSSMSMSMSSGDLCKVLEIKAMAKPGKDQVQTLLEKIAKQVQPIMKKRNWRVNLLSEFYPGNPSLLGLNIGAGQEIRIRIRKPGREWDFYPYEDLLGTMLHELSHNEHGPHNSNFYKLLDEITKECEELMVKGISGSGQGFDTMGRRLGGYSHNPSMLNGRQAALAAAEKRARMGSLMPSGPHRLGGDSDIMKALSPVQAAAMAAERRLRDDLWCGAPDTFGENGMEKAKRREETAHLNGSKSVNGTEAGSSRSNNREEEMGALVSNDQQYGKRKFNQVCPMWECTACTLLNQPLAVVCEACMTVRKEVAKHWTCSNCTLLNPLNLDNCEACNQWRYSHGSPVSSRGPHVGT